MVILCKLLCTLQKNQCACLYDRLISFPSLVVLNYITYDYIRSIFLKRAKNLIRIPSQRPVPHKPRQISLNGPLYERISTFLNILATLLLFTIYIHPRSMSLFTRIYSDRLPTSRSYPRCLPHRLNANHQTVCQSSDTVAR